MERQESSISYLISSTGYVKNEATEWEKARLEYMNLIESPDAKTNLIDRVMVGVKAMDLQEELVGNEYIFPKKTPECQDSTINIVYNRETYIFDGTQPITFGRSEWNDIVAKDESSQVSRCHFIAIPIYDRSIIIIVDFASLSGTGIHSRSSDKSCPKSTQYDKNLIILDWEEAADIRVNLGAPSEQKLLLGPKMCIICMEKARTEVFECGENNQGHLVACEDCIKSLDQCPLCRKQVPIRHVSNSNKMHMQTLVNFSL